ncbi:Indole-3-glycerol phosphate synthase TrpC [Methanonatronarchaeum thermophilum]|uniref:indole-3-glycerol-phosphate synthase n=1 Tax=Methanonatronarchaeum thermophilum TaxID=1927129 RepID=A0A1Y3GDW8_9EURY|nr:indole-3-glycerol-phosphate synthase [Methanonatronarchaeum thermophilum]OUJ19417.1 Indole-3-glycerol phosphate synthase TrpC [Methanonatronarchaeum thermophilum]
MPSVLKKIEETVKKDLEKNRQTIENHRKPTTKTKSLKKAIKTRSRKKTSIIAELKYSSPSKGQIKKPTTNETKNTIKKLENAQALSILTEPHYFNGKKEYIKIARKNYNGPILRKDFIIDPIQIKETRQLGADAVLLITSLLDTELPKYLKKCRQNQLEALVEVRTPRELDIALKSNADIIGINNRNLNNLKIDLNTTIKLSKKIPTTKTTISESGIQNKNDIKKLKPYCDGFLIGTELMNSKNPEKRLEDLLCA